MSEDKVLAVDIGGSKVSFAVLDAAANVSGKIETCAVPFDAGNVADAQELIRLIEHQIEKGEISRENLKAIGISSCGNIDMLSGDAVLVPNLHWHNIPFSKMLAEKIQLPVYAATDVRQALLAEVLWGKAQNRNYVAWATIGTGYGGYLFLDGKMYGGSHGFAGNFGHNTLDESNGYLCGCGKRGCVETFVAGPAIARAGQTTVDGGYSPILSSKASHGKVTSQMVFEAEREGDAAASEVIKEVVRKICISLSGMVNILDLEMIVMGGGIVRGNPELVSRINEGIRPYLMTVEAKRDLRVELETFENSALFGAGAHAFERLGILKIRGAHE